jgi:hypothetical protein
MHTSSKASPSEPASARRLTASLRNDLGPISNALLYLTFCVLAATGLAMTFRLDDGRAMMLGLAKQDWARVHAITALSVLSLVVLHLWLNWGWIRSVLARARWHTLVFALVGLAIIAVALLAPVASPPPM